MRIPSASPALAELGAQMGARLGAVARPEIVIVLLAALLAVQAGRLAWLFVAPGAPAAASTPAAAPLDPTVFQRIDAFFRAGAASSLAEATGAEADQLRLFGVRAGGMDGGSAIIGLADGTQRSVIVGEEVTPGLRLQSVGADHVTLSRGGSVSRLVFTETPLGAAAPPPPPATAQVVGPQPSSQPASDLAVDPAALARQAGLRPRMKGLSIDGFLVSAAGDGSAVRAAGLRSGDVILAVNGVELNSLQAAAGLREQLAQADSAELRIERDGQPQTLTLRTGG